MESSAGAEGKTAFMLRLINAAVDISECQPQHQDPPESTECEVVAPFFSLGFDAFKMRTLAISFMWNEL